MVAPPSLILKKELEQAHEKAKQVEKNKKAAQAILLSIQLQLSSQVASITVTSKDVKSS